MSGPNRTPTRWVIFFLLLLAVLILGIVIPIQLINNPITVSSFELPASSLTNTPGLAAAALVPDIPPPTLLLVGGTVEGPRQNCTYSLYFHLNNPEKWPVQVIVNDLNYTKEDAIAWIETDPADIGTLLFVQFHVAYLNLLSGADPAEVTQALVEASRWLVNFQSGSPLVEADYQYGMDLAGYLARFNNGLAGPGRCADEPAPGRITELGLHAPVLLMTPTWSGVFIPATSAPTLTQILIAGTTSSALPTAALPGGSSPTSAFRLSPTATSRIVRPPNSTPTSQPTQVPTATQRPPTATQPPPPTATQPPPTQPPPTQPPPTQPPPTQPPPTSAPTEET